MRVQVDQPRCHELAGRVDPLHGAIGRDAGRHGGDLAVPDADVALGAQLLAGIEHIAVGDDQLVLERGVGRIEAARRRRAAGLRELQRRLRVRRGGGAGGGRRARHDEVATREVHDGLLTGAAWRRGW